MRKGYVLRYITINYYRHDYPTHTRKIIMMMPQIHDIILGCIKTIHFSPHALPIFQSNKHQIPEVTYYSTRPEESIEVKGICFSRSPILEVVPRIPVSACRNLLRILLIHVQKG